MALISQSLIFFYLPAVMFTVSFHGFSVGIYGGVGVLQFFTPQGKGNSPDSEGNARNLTDFTREEKQ